MWRIESHDEPRNARLASNLITSWKPGSIYFVVGIVQHGRQALLVVEMEMENPNQLSDSLGILV